MKTGDSRSLYGRKDKTWIAGVLLALTASLCCLTPVLALISGLGGIAATFSWLEPFRPYLIGITLLVLALAWYLKLKRQKKDEIECNCEEGGKVNFWQSQIFLSLVTILAIALLTFPNYARIFYPDDHTINGYEVKSIDAANRTSVSKVEFFVKGMTCSGCEEHIRHTVSELEGVTEVAVSYEEGKAVVSYDKSKTAPEKIETAINSTGYKVVDDN